MLELVEISKNYYTISGELHSILGNFHTNDIEKENWFDYEIDIDCLDLHYKVKTARLRYFSLHDTLLRKLSNKIHSQNDYVCLYELLFEQKKFDTRILNLRIGKAEDFSLRETLISYIEDVPVIPINIYEYGFQNKITIYVSIETFLDIIKNKKLKDYKITEYVENFKIQHDIDIETITVNDFLETLNETRQYTRSNPRQRKGLAYKYYNKLCPNFKKGNFVIDEDGDILKILSSSMEKWNNYDKGNVIEREYYISTSGFKMTSKGMSKRLVYLFYKDKHNLICHESEYNLLATKYNLPKEPNKMSLLKIFRINSNNEQGKN